MAEKRKPDIRFKGFTDDWEQRKLGEVAQYRNGKAHENYIDDNGKYIVVNSKFVSTDGEVKKFSNMQNDALFENEIAFVLSDVPNGRAIARTFLVEKSDKYTLNQRIAGITPLSETHPYYLYILMNRHPYFLAFDDGAKQTNLSVSDVMGFESYYPKYKEQKKIGEYFHNLDNLITLHQRKYDKLINVKKFMLQKMFPQNGSNVPEIRFAGFTDVWEQRKFGDITEIKSALRVHKEEWTNTGVPFYRSSDVMSAINGTTNTKAFISEELYEKLSSTSGKLEKGDVLVTGGGSVGNPYIVPNNEPLYTKDADLLWIKNNEKFDSYFVYEFFFSPVFRTYLESISHVGTIAHYTITQLADTPIALPSIEEQKQIGACFKNLDNLITLHHNKLEKLKKIKKSMLEKMFI